MDAGHLMLILTELARMPPRRTILVAAFAPTVIALAILILSMPVMMRAQEPCELFEPRLLRIIEDNNVHDIELYEWARKRFAEQRKLYEPELSRDLQVFSVVNRALTTAGEILPWTLRKRLAQILFYAR